MGTIRVVRGSEIHVGATTEGAVRKVAEVDDLVSFGELRCPPQTMSGWHHHGEHTTCAYVRQGRLRVEWGPGSHDGAELAAGDFYVVPPDTVHREGNPGSEEQVLVGFYVGSGEHVGNVEGPRTGGSVRVFRSEDLPAAAGTEGMSRQMSDAAEPVSVAVVRCSRRTVSGWHHHGQHTTCVYVAQGQVRIEWGPAGRESADLVAGDVYVQSANTIHRETNPGSQEQVLLGFEIGTGPQVVNEDGAEPETMATSGSAT